MSILSRRKEGEIILYFRINVALDGKVKKSIHVRLIFTAISVQRKFTGDYKNCKHFYLLLREFSWHMFSSDDNQVNWYGILKNNRIVL